MCLLDYHVSLLIWLNPAYIRITMSVGHWTHSSGQTLQVKICFLHPTAEWLQLSTQLVRAVFCLAYSLRLGAGRRQGSVAWRVLQTARLEICTYLAPQ